MIRTVWLLVLLCALGCGGAGQLRVPDPVPDDRRDIPTPKKNKIYVIANAFEQQVSKQAKRSFDLSRVIRKVSGSPKEAFNIDAFDGVRDSSWFTNRNGRTPLTLEEIRRGPDAGHGPDTSGTWTVVAAKSEGVTPGFTIEDSRGDRYFLKFDPPGYNELMTAAEVIATKLIYASGYHTPENYVTYFHPDRLELGDNVTLREEGKKRPMTPQDIDRIMRGVERRPDGTIRAVASRFLQGKVLGPFRYEGTRKDDPNDFIPHEHRRELRGLRMIAAWLNHYDTKANNTLDVHVEGGGRRYVRHYLIDFGSTLGSRGNEPMSTWTGHENFFDGGSILANTWKLGLHVPEWEKKNTTIRYPSVGLFRYEPFDPMKYKFSIPNPAFANLTNRDGYWAVKIVTSFTDEQIEAAVETGSYSNPEAAAYVARVLVERRNIMGRFWFNRVNCLDEFAVAGDPDGGQLSFVDLAVETGIESADGRRYQYQILRDGKAIGEAVEMSRADPIGLPAGEAGMVEVRVRNRRGDGNWAGWVSVYVESSPDSGEYTLVAVARPD
ncbi:MAG: hypothetical protein V3V49_04075 [Candidatus Krumholzibacteria bacterium]